MDTGLMLRAVAALAFLGAAASFVLAVASKRFHVEVDPRVEQIASVLPGSNCGACGNPSCFATAEGIAADHLPITACIAGGQEVADAIAELLDVQKCEVSAVVTARLCGGGSAAARAYEYHGVRSCAAASRLAGGPLVCASGCIGFGDCVKACPFDALQLDERGLPVVDLARCTGCGVCVQECPRGQGGLLMLVPDGASVVVRCNAHTKPKERKAACPRCCIACKRCERACPEDAIHVVEMLAVVDYEKCTGCGACAEVCPQQCIDIYGRRADVDARQADGRRAGARAHGARDAEIEGASV